MKKIVLIIFLLVSFSFFHFKNTETKANFYNIIHQLNTIYTTDSISEKEQKKHQRFKWFWKNRVATNGDFDLYYKNYMQSNQLFSEFPIVAKNALWNLVGPQSFPENKYNLSNRKNLIGIGHIKAVYVYPEDKNHILIGAQAGGLWETKNGGKNWKCLTNKIPTLTIKKIEVVDGIIYAASGFNQSVARLSNITDTQDYGLGVIKSEDDGETWQWDSKTPFNCVGFSVSKQKKSIMYACSTTSIYKSINAGITWKKQQDLTKAIYGHSILDGIEVHPTNPNIAFAYAYFSYGKKALNSAVLFKTTNGGKLWLEENTLFENTFSAKELNLNTVGNGVKLYYNSKEKTLYATLLTNGYLKGKNKLFLYKTTDWQHWQRINDKPSYGGSMLSNALLVENDISYFGGIYLMRSTKKNPTFKNISNAKIHVDIRDLKMHSKTLYVATDGGLFSSSDGGETYNNLNGDLNVLQAYSMSYTNNGNVKSLTIGTQDDGYYRNDLDGTNWYNLTPWGEGAAYTYPLNKEVIFTKNSSGQVYKSIDGGKTAKRIKLNNEIVKFGDWENPVLFHPKENTTILTELKIKKDQGLFVSKNLGDTWQMIYKNKPAQRVSTMAYSKSKPTTFYFSTVTYQFKVLPWKFTTEMYKTTNGGKTYKIINKGLENVASKAKINAILVHPKNSKKVWICFGNLAENNKVFCTENGGKSWKNISKNLPNIPANRLAFDAVKNTLFLGTDYGLYTYKNNKWHVYGSGLPKTIISDIAIDQQTKEIYVSTFGRGVWKTTLSY